MRPRGGKEIMITTRLPQVPALNRQPAATDSSNVGPYNRQTRPGFTRRQRRSPFALVAIATAAIVICCQSRVIAQEGEVAPDTKPQATTTRKPVLPQTEQAVNHPLLPVVKYAKERIADVQRRVQDYSCRLVKRERIEGQLQEYQYVDVWVREGSRTGKQTSPMSVLLEYLSPVDVKGRKVLYVENQNDNKLLVRRGGKRYSYVVTSLDPRGNTARHESVVPVTEVSFERLIRGMMERVEKDVELDPTGANTQVQSATAKVNQRPCQVIRIIHPARQEGLVYHIASVYVDAELQVPVRIEAYDWPDDTSAEPPLRAEYTYTNLRLNQNLSDDIFRAELLRNE
jgi:hypothetical protein